MNTINLNEQSKKLIFMMIVNTVHNRSHGGHWSREWMRHSMLPPSDSFCLHSKWNMKDETTNETKNRVADDAVGVELDARIYLHIHIFIYELCRWCTKRVQEKRKPRCWHTAANGNWSAHISINTISMRLCKRRYTIGHRCDQNVQWTSQHQSIFNSIYDYFYSLRLAFDGWVRVRMHIFHSAPYLYGVQSMSILFHFFRPSHSQFTTSSRFSEMLEPD